MRIINLFLVFLPLSINNGSMGDNLNFLPEPKIEEKKVYELPSEVVTLTTYSPSESETDSTPNITASGFKIDKNNPGKHKIIAVSRDLKRRGWKFNKKVRIKGAGRYNGVYTIKDVMNKRHRKRIDVLVGEERSPIKLSNVKVTLLK